MSFVVNCCIVNWIARASVINTVKLRKGRKYVENDYKKSPLAKKNSIYKWTAHLTKVNQQKPGKGCLPIVRIYIKTNGIVKTVRRFLKAS